MVEGHKGVALTLSSDTVADHGRLLDRPKDGESLAEGIAGGPPGDSSDEDLPVRQVQAGTLVGLLENASAHVVGNVAEEGGQVLFREGFQGPFQIVLPLLGRYRGGDGEGIRGGPGLIVLVSIRGC